MFDETNWKRVGPLSGSIHAEMVGEVLEERQIPYFISHDWFSGAFGLNTISAVGNTAVVFVPEEYYNDVIELVNEMFGEAK
jgi:hypothetical protein